MLKKLKTLNMSHNKVCYLPDEILQLENIKFMDFYGNQGNFLMAKYQIALPELLASSDYTILSLFKEILEERVHVFGGL